MRCQAGNKLAVSLQHFGHLTGIYELAAKMFSIHVAPTDLSQPFDGLTTAHSYM
jgi:hypothetical protein